MLIFTLLAAPLASARSLSSELLTVRYAAGERELAREVATAGDRAQLAIAAALDLDPRPVELELVRGLAALRQRVPRAPEWALAVALPRSSRVYLRADLIRRLDNRLGPTLSHELTHILLEPRQRKQRLPTWFEEGLCDWVGGSPHLTSTAGSAARLELQAALGTLPAWRELDAGVRGNREQAAASYAVSFAIVGWIERERPGTLKRLLVELDESASFEQAFGRACGRSLEQMEARWREQLTPRWPLLTIVWHTFDVNMVMVALLLVGVWLAWRKARRQLAIWREEEALARAIERGELQRVELDEPTGRDPPWGQPSLRASGPPDA